MRRTILICLLTLVFMFGSNVVGCGGQVQLPEYVHREPNGAVYIDVVEASGGSAYFKNPERPVFIIYN